MALKWAESGILLLFTIFGLQQSIVDSAVDQWRKSLRYCVETSSRHFEHFAVGLALQLELV